ncbi:MAG: DNA-binding protein [Marinospirillum sp.]|uniref:DNA-binding protein n=1 Tax=Marinospirillum sp. TaxID=2183934 RepID=UPI0019E53742|nr:DNA-binding protein [Marinospirillum sp.]MBE0505794.1 DNA-binding protein [Marinospirillum sp.]
MARNGVQYQQVVQVIQELQRQGENPTVQRIREALGTGSFTTLSEHLRQWRDEQRNATPLQQESKEVPDTLLNLTRELWQAACAEADLKLQHYQQAADQEIRQALSDKQLAMEEALRTEEKNLLLERKNTELLRDIKQLTADISRIQTLLEEKDKHLLTLEINSQEREATAAASIQKLQAELQEQQQKHLLALQQQKEEHQSVLAHEQQRNEENQLRWMQEVDLARQETRNLQEKLQQQALEIKQERAQLQQALKTSQQQVQDQQQELQARQLREQEIKQQLEAKEQQLKQLQAQSIQQEASLKLQLEEKIREVKNNQQEIATLKAAAASYTRPAPLIMI